MSLSLSVSLWLVSLAQQGDFQQCTRVLRTLTGEAAGDQFGWVSAPVPDVTGDGREELLVGAPFHATGGVNAGRAYLYDVHGGIELFHADGAPEERLGHSLRRAGDFDLDGIEDVILGGPGAAGVRGVARVLSGATGVELLTLTASARGTSFGYAVDGIGDVDGDGVIDFAVGAPLDDTGGLDAGRVWILSGADGVTVLRSFSGTAAGANLGTALGRLSDLSGDGIAELLVGAANAGAGSRGRAYVFDVGVGVLHFPELVPDASAGEFGQFFVAEVGRVNSDLVPDFYVGDFADNGTRGKAYVFDGASGTRIWTFTGQSGDGFGIGRGLGDTNGDGFDDLVLGAWTQSGGASRAGRLEVYSGADASRLRRVTSTTANEALGFDAHGIADLDGDGRPELVGTAANHANNRGRVYVIADRPLEVLGSGLAGSGGSVPELDLGGCPRLGAAATLDLTSAVGGGSGTLFIGAERRDRPVRGGVLYPFEIVLRQAFVAGGMPGAPGEGTFTLPVMLPADPTLVGMSFHLQAVVADSAAVAGFSFTPGLRLTLY